MKCSRILSSILALALVFNLFAAVAFAKTSRTALISDVSGDVSVTKGGGVSPIPAFPNMPLNEGDSITTGEDGTVTVQIADPDSTRTIGPNSDVTISELSDEAGDKKSGFKVWVGSMWNKVKTLASGNEDEVETPTATMGVRGTQYLVIANPDGTLSVVVASGLVSAEVSSKVKGDNATAGGGDNGTNSPEGKSVLLAPTQQIELNPGAQPTDLADAVSIVDVTNVVQQADPSIIKAFVVDAPNIATENKQLIDQLKTDLQDGKPTTLQRGGAVSDLSIKSLDDLNKVSQNINGLVANIANTAVQLNKVQSAELTNLINQANSKITGTDQKIDLNNVKPIDKTAGVDPAVAQQKKEAQEKLSQELQQKALDRQRQLAELTRQLTALLQQVTDQKKKLDEQNKKAQDDLNKKAETSYVSTLSDAEKKSYEEKKNDLTNPTPSNPTPPATTPTGSGATGTGSNSDSSSNDPTPVATPKVTLQQTATTSGFNLNVTLSNFTGANKIYAAELHFLSDSGTIVGSSATSAAASVIRNTNKFADTNSVDTVKAYTGTVGTASKVETIYAVTHFNTQDTVEFNSSGENLVTIPVIAPNAGTYNYQLAYALFVDQTGKPVAVFDSSKTTGNTLAIDNSGKFSYTKPAQ